MRLAAATVLAAVLATGCATTADAPAPAGPRGREAMAVSPPPATSSAASSPPGSPSPVPSPTPSPTPTLTVEREPFDATRAMAVVTALADEIGPRPAGTDADVATRAYVAGALRAAGWVVREELVALPQGGTTANVVARAPGTSLGRPHVVVGAHLDTVPGAPGANDNATGVGVLVALAEELADEHATLTDPVVLVAFGAEEYQPSEPREHHLGSQAYVDRRAGLVLEMLNVDMVGNGSPTCICWLRDHDDTLARQLADVAAGEDLAVRVEARGDISDHGPFAKAGIPAAFLWTFEDGVLHSPQDTSDRVRPHDVARAGQLVLAWLRSR